MGFDSEIPPVPLWTDRSQKQLDFTRLVLCLREQFISGKEIYISLKFLELLLKQYILETAGKAGEWVDRDRKWRGSVQPPSSA